MKKIVVFILLNCVIACGVNSKKNVGKYYTVKPDIISIVELKDNGKFIYTFERDSFCSGKIEGNYKIENKKIKFNHHLLIKLIGLFVLILSIVFLYYQLLKELGITF